MARRRGQTVSQLLKVECDFCAYCLDEAFVLREWAQANEREKEAQAQSEVDDHSATVDRLLKHG